MKRIIILILISFLLIVSVSIGTTVANSQDHNHNTNGEDGNYVDNNQNPYDDEDAPGLDTRQRSGQEW